MVKTMARSWLFALGILTVVSAPAASFPHIDLPGTRSKEYIQDLCRTAKGKYLEGQGQYGCMTNCGQPGMASDACGINCSEKTNKCYGWAPDLTSRSTPADAVHPPAKSGSGK